jgi:NAD(P)-dependent dehydrogenase (short-subunit alcohol dehydrogenase family)
VHLLFNNAGVGVARDLLDSTAADWKWIMGVNLWGVINGIRVFLPIMLSRDTEGHIVNTASAGVWMNTGGSGIYKVSKRGMIGLTHALYHALADRDAKIGVSLLYPGHVQSRIHLEPERNRPELVRRDPVQARLRERDTRMVKEVLGDRVGMSPAEVAEIVFNAIRESRFYILTHPRWKILAQLQMEELLLERNPVHLRPTEPAKIKRATLRVLFRDLIPWPGWGYLFARGARRGRPRTQERKGYIAR